MKYQTQNGSALEAGNSGANCDNDQHENCRDRNIIVETTVRASAPTSVCFIESVENFSVNENAWLPHEDGGQGIDAEFRGIQKPRHMVKAPTELSSAGGGRGRSGVRGSPRD